MTATVTAVSTTADRLGLEVEVTIRRGNWHSGARAEDVPADIRASLLAWLESAR